MFARSAAPGFAIPILLGAGAALYLVNLGGYPLYTKGEPREAVTIFDIVHGGGWILPMRAGVEIPSKPLMMHWLGAILSIAAGRVNEWTVRLPSAMLAIAAMIACYLYVRRLFDDRIAMLSALMLGTSVQYLQAGGGARVDSTLTFFMTVAFFEFISIAEGLSRRWLVMYLAVAAAVLTKGPVGALLPALVALIWIAIERRWDLIGRLHLLPGAALVAILGGGWYLAAGYAGGLDFFRKQIVAENLARFAGGPQFSEGHAHPFYYVEAALLAGFMPWSLLIPAPASRLARSPRPLGPRLRYLVVWFLTVLIFYNLARSKRGVYLLALYPALTSIIAVSLGDAFSTNQTRSRWLGAFASLAGLTLAAAGCAAIAAPLMLKMNPAACAGLLARFNISASGFMPALGHAIVARWIVAIVLALAIAALGVFLIVVRPALEATVALIAAGVVSITLTANLFVQPAIANTIGLKAFTADAMRIVGANPVAYLEGLNYDVAFYSGRSIPIVRLGDRDQPDYLFCSEDAFDRLDAAQSGGFSLVLTSGPTELNDTGGMVLLKRVRR
ncbi:MAG: ArnT family glycosyltransferase [Candidatus Binatales bacterium]